MSDDARTSDPVHRDRRRRRLGLASIAVLGLSWVLVMQSLGWAQTSYFALVKSLNDGTAQIDAYHWETRDKSWTNGHFFSVKAPGLPALLVPPYAALKALGADDLARDAAREAREGGRAAVDLSRPQRPRLRLRPRPRDARQGAARRPGPDDLGARPARERAPDAARCCC